MSGFEINQVVVDTHHKGDTFHAAIPETVVGAEGSAKRNIIRKGRRKGGGKMGISIDDGSNYTEAGGAMDEHDPNFDSEEENGEEYIPVGSPDRNGYLTSDLPQQNSMMTLSHYKRSIKPIIEQYFLSADVDDVRRSVLELNTPPYSYEFVKRLITMSMDRNDKERELVSRLLSEFYPDVLSTNVIGKGFERLFEIMDELEKDAPRAKDITATFIARCVVDEILPPSFLSDVVICSLGGDIIEHARRMLSREHMGARLERAWGPGDGRPVSEMKVDVDLLLQEYLLSRDVDEAAQCVKQLNAPHFLHEVVKRAITCGLERTSQERTAMNDLLVFLKKEDIVSPLQMQMGYQLVRDRLNDIILDVPAARALFDESVSFARAANLIQADF